MRSWPVAAWRSGMTPKIQVVVEVKVKLVDVVGALLRIIITLVSLAT